MRYRISAILLALIVFGLLITPAQAGGWAVVTLDSVPPEIRAGQRLDLGFMVRQHGVTPIDTAFNSSSLMIPVLSATNQTTGEKVQAEAVKNGVKGHFSVAVSFPSAGDWQWQITPPPFEGTQLGTLKVLTPLASPLTTPQPVNNLDFGLLLMRWGGLGFLGLAAILAVGSWFATTRRGRTLRSR